MISKYYKSVNTKTPLTLTNAVPKCPDDVLQRGEVYYLKHLLVRASNGQ